MASVISGSQLRSAVERNHYIVGGTPDNVEGVKYDFRLGKELLKAEFETPVDITKLSEVEKGKARINPGEAVFVLTEERLTLPKNVIATLIPKRKISHEGVITLGGLLVDPLYDGKLLIGLYNFSSTYFLLKPGRKIIAAVLYELDDGEIDDFPVPRDPIDGFPDDLIKLIRSYEPIPIQSLRDNVEKISRELNEVKSLIDSGQKWQEDFRADLTDLKNALQAERDNRIENEKSFREEIKTLHRGLLRFNITKEFIIGIGGIILGIILTIFLPKLFGS